LRRFAEERELDLNIYTVSIDPQINDKRYTVPRLGDVEDRVFGS
jgi:uracil phosphoribosyltransferase